MTEIQPGLDREGVAAVVCAALDRHGVRAVLCGGAVVSIYSNNAFESFDLDFVLPGLSSSVAPAMLELGFQKQGRHWRHADSRYWVEFPPGPVQVGDSIVRDFTTRVTAGGTLRLLAPTECVMDRLAGFFHWNDPQCLEQAVAVARAQEIDLDRIRARCKRERVEARLAEFTARLDREP